MGSLDMWDCEIMNRTGQHKKKFSKSGLFLVFRWVVNEMGILVAFEINDEEGLLRKSRTEAFFLPLT